jgi:hypothetical protein
MTRYLLSVHSVEGQASEPMTPEQMQRQMQEMGDLEGAMRSSNALVLSARLTGSSQARVVRSSKGKTLATDGPFVEAKEQIAGFYIIDADDLDAAAEWAARTSAVIGMPIEVRPFADWAGA